ncbi:MAG: RodZ domain-containing protein [Pseudomonadota bacterium]
MIGRRQSSKTPQEDGSAKRFDDFPMLLGDVMRGERATLGKSLLDVQRDLKIKATYIAAIENADATAFETPGFIAGYVRSYARYLNLDAEWAFDKFCAEASFVPANGFDRGIGGSTTVKQSRPSVKAPDASDAIFGSSIAFAPRSESVMSRIEPGAIGSSLVLLALIGAIGYGGWAVLREVQQVQVTPVENTPGVVAEIDPLENIGTTAEIVTNSTSVPRASADALDRLYRPEALDVPVMIARDGPIVTIDPGLVGALSETRRDEAFEPSSLQANSLPPTAPFAEPERQRIELGLAGPNQPKVLAENAPEVMLVAVNEAWVRVRSAEGTVILEKVLQPGDTFELPKTELPATLRTGAAGAVYFTVNGETYGPAGGRGAVVDNIALGATDLTQAYAKVDPASDSRAEEAVRFAEAALLGTDGEEPTEAQE